MNKKKNISKKDLTTWLNYLKDPKDIYDKENVTIKKRLKKSFRFDLHGYSLKDANTKIKSIITDCYHKNIKEIILITGKGLHSKDDIYSSKTLSKLRYSIPNFINSDEISKYIKSVSVAEKNKGADGVLIIKLKTL